MKKFNFLKLIDVFYEQAIFTHEGNKEYKSTLGGMLSIILIIASAIIAILFGQELYQRKRPNVSESSEFRETSRINMFDWPLFITFSDAYGEKFHPDGYYDIFTYIMNFTETGKVDFADVSPFHPVVRCNSTHFEKVKDKISEKEINNYLEWPSYCIDYDFQGILQNPYKTLNSTFLDIDVGMCDTSSRKCADNYDDIMTEGYFHLYFLNAYIDSNDNLEPVK